MALIGCMATYNEAALVAEAIDSLWRIGCDRVLVVDGAWGNFDPGNHHVSTDGTLEIAVAHGAQVIQPGRRWHDQPEARSQYLVGEPGDWYLVCDADERCRGVLPELDGPVEAYLVQLRGEATRFSRMRLFRHSGRMEYKHRHYCVYADGRLIEPTVQAPALWLEHLPRDARRTAIKEQWYVEQTANEHARPAVKRLPPEQLGPLSYISGRGWLPGVPARNLSADEADTYYWLLIGNLRGARPIYEQAKPLPAASPAKPKRTQRRKE